MRAAAILVISVFAIVPAHASSPQCNRAKLAGIEKMREVVAAGKSLNPNAPPTSATCQQARLVIKIYRRELALFERSELACDSHDPSKIEAERENVRNLSVHLQTTYCAQ